MPKMIRNGLHLLARVVYLGCRISSERLTAKREVAGSNREAGRIPRVLKYVRNKGTSFAHALQAKWW